MQIQIDTSSSWEDTWFWYSDQDKRLKEKIDMIKQNDEITHLLQNRLNCNELQPRSLDRSLHGQPQSKENLIRGDVMSL